MKKLKKIPTPTVGEILKEEFLEPLGISAYRLSKELHVSTTTILDIINGKRKITIDTSLRLSKFFGMSEKYWINIQNDIDFRNKKDILGKELESIHTYQTA